MFLRKHAMEVSEYSEAFSLADDGDFAFSFTKVILRSGSNWYYATTQDRFMSAHDINVTALRPKRIDLERVRPPYSPEFTRAKSSDLSDAYIKRPSLLDYGDSRNTHELSSQLLHEARICEKLRANSHPHVAKYHGVVVEHNAIVGLCFTKYDMTLARRFKDPRPFDRKRFWLQLHSGVLHLHSLGYIHNDINPHNIMIHRDEPVIIDFDSCQRKGDPLGSKRGTAGFQREGMKTAEYENDSYSLSKIQELLFGDTTQSSSKESAQ